MHDSRSLLSRRFFVECLGGLAALSAAFSAAGSEPSAGERTLQFWFVRHAESEINVDTVAHAQTDDGVTYPLTRTGMQQATTLAEALASTPITTIYSSTRLRAIQTADAIAFRHGLNVNLAPEAIEIDLGIPIDAPRGRELYRDLVRKWIVDRDTNAHIGEGETFVDAQRRFLPFVRELMNRHADDTGVVLIISHGATLSVLVPVLATNVPADFALSHPLLNTSVIKTELSDGKLSCIEWAGIPESEFKSPAALAQQIPSH
ncbi:MAG: histidine phosphatase family protein [Povalibacter sp.]